MLTLVLILLALIFIPIICAVIVLFAGRRLLKARSRRFP